MVRKCEIYGKGKIFGSTVSFSHHRGNGAWPSNVRRVRVIVDESPKKIYVCTRCLRSRKVKRTL